MLGGGLFSLSEGYGELVHGPGQRAVADTGLRGGAPPTGAFSRPWPNPVFCPVEQWEGLVLTHFNAKEAA